MWFMKLIRVIGLLLSLSGLPFPSGQTSVAPSTVQLAGKLKGVVLDANGARVVNVIVKVESGKIERQARVGGEGEFEIELPGGRYRITAEASGFRRFVYASLEVKPAETTEFKIRLKVAEPRGLTPASAQAPARLDGLGELSANESPAAEQPVAADPPQRALYVRRSSRVG